MADRTARLGRAAAGRSRSGLQHHVALTEGDVLPSHEVVPAGSDIDDARSVGLARAERRARSRSRPALEALPIELETADPLKRLQLTREEIDLTDELARFDQGVDLTDLENEFTKVAKSYADRKDISYTAFRQVGVPASVLKAAGITRGPTT